VKASKARRQPTLKACRPRGSPAGRRAHSYSPTRTHASRDLASARELLRAAIPDRRPRRRPPGKYSSAAPDALEAQADTVAQVAVGDPDDVLTPTARDAHRAQSRSEPTRESGPRRCASRLQRGQLAASRRRDDQQARRPHRRARIDCRGIARNEVLEQLRPLTGTARLAAADATRPSKSGPR